ncbi:atrial natriuretic peptide receptor 1-like isoform X2 [Paramacrobiotus metropolitanus]|nr:atrial natriuretic peptide receptor 1-like isoform X2 [Paramacrobiotus metropolitanus]XP_055352768.1 atrial natriuretic peptide receptor 1-like isoform X2 [Paramacrobiotus metropolitanus]
MAQTLLMATMFWTISAQISQSDDRVNVTMCVMYERDTVGLLYDFNRAQPALDLALTYVNEAVVAPDMFIRAIYRNIGTSCTDPGLTYAAQHALYLHDQGINCDVYLGPGCGSAADALYDLALTWHKPVIGLPSASVGLLITPYYYDHLTRMSFTFPTLNAAVVSFLNYFNYTSPAFFYDNSQNFFSEAGRLILASLQQNYTKLFAASKLTPFDSDLATDDSLVGLLQSASKVSRVFFILTDAENTRRIMLLARQLGMVGGDYVFIAIELYSSDVWGTFTWQSNDANDAAAREAYRALLIFSLDINNKNDESADNLRTFWKEIIEISKTKFNYTFPKIYTDRVDPIIAHFYEAVVLYASQAYAMYQQNLTYQNGAAFTSYVAQKLFPSPLTGSFYLDENSERRSPYVMKIMDDHTGQYGIMVQIDASAHLTVVGAFTFVGQPGLPPNEPRCGFKDDNPVCIAERSALPKGTIEAAVSVPLIVFFALVAGAAYVLKRALSDDSDPFWWRIILADIDIATATTTSYRSSMRSSLTHHTAHADEEKEDLKKEQEVKATRTANISGVSVTLVELPSPKHRVPSDTFKAAGLAKTLVHRNIQKFIGIAVNEDNQCDSIVGEVCQKGTLRDLVSDAAINLDWEFKSAIMKDLVNGMVYLHTSKLRSHGFLNDQNCLIDNRFILKICSYGFPSLRSEDDLQAVSVAPEERNYNILLWRAPELLRRTMPPNGTQQGDIYSFGILLQQIILRSAPYQIGDSGQGKNAVKRRSDREQISDRDIVQDVRRGLVPPLRPAVPISACPMELYELMTMCWDEDPLLRQPFVRVKAVVAKVVGRAGENIVDHLIKRMEQYAAGLEHEVEVKMKQFMEERQRSAAFLGQLLPKYCNIYFFYTDTLIRAVFPPPNSNKISFFLKKAEILPWPVADALGRGIQVVPETFEHTTVYFGDVPGFAEAIEQCESALDTVELLNKLYSVCDAVVASHDVYKVETITDAYLVASGVPVRNGNKHAEQVASMALGIRREISSLRATMDKAKNFKLRAGLHSGSCVAGVIGLKMPKYCLFGDTVNTASRMESHGEAGKIHISAATKTILDRFDDFIVSERGIIDIKGKGPMQTYWLIGRN